MRAITALIARLPLSDKRIEHVQIETYPNGVVT